MRLTSNLITTIFCLFFGLNISQAQCNSANDIIQAQQNTTRVNATSEEEQGQTFTATCDGLLRAVTFSTDYAPETKTANIFFLSLNNLSDTENGTIMSGYSFTIQQSRNQRREYTVVLGDGLQVTAGDHYMFALFSSGNAEGKATLTTTSNGNAYSEGAKVNRLPVTGSKYEIDSNDDDLYFKLYYEDSQPPVAQCKPGITINLAATGQYTLTANEINNGSYDQGYSGIASMTVFPNEFDISNLGENIVELSVFDAAGNFDSCEATVTVELETSVTLTAGDIAFMGVNSESGSTTASNVSFVFLKDIPIGTQIIFTDRGWSDDTGLGGIGVNSGASRTDGELVWTADRNYNIGEIITLDLSLGQLSNEATLATQGDQLFALQGSIENPTFIAGLHYNVARLFTTNDDDWDTVNDNGVLGLVGIYSALPDVLVTGDTAVRLFYLNALDEERESDNFRFSCALAGGIPILLTPAEMRAVLHNPENWNHDDSSGFNPPVENGCSISVGEQTQVSLDAGKLIITDIGNDTDDQITLSLSNDGATLIISNLILPTVSGGPSLSDDTTVTVPLTSITNGIEFIGGEGNNSITFADDLTLTGVDNDITLTGLKGYTQNGSINIEGDFTISNGFDFDLLLGELTANNLTIDGVDKILDQELALTITGVTQLQAVDGIDIDDGQSRHSFAGAVNLTAGQIVFSAGADTTFGTIMATDTGTNDLVHELRVAGNIIFNGNVTIPGNRADLFVSIVGGDVSQTSGIIQSHYLIFRGVGNRTVELNNNNNNIDILATRNPQNANNVAFTSLSFTNSANLFLGEINVNEFNLTAPKFTLVPDDFTVITKEGTGVSNFNGNIDVDDDTGTATINHNAGTINFNGDTNDFRGNITYIGAEETITNINSDNTNFPSAGTDRSFTFGFLNGTGDIAMADSEINILNEATFTGEDTIVTGTGSLSSGSTIVESSAVILPNAVSNAFALNFADLTISSGTFIFDINGDTGHSKINVAGTVTLNDATLFPIVNEIPNTEIIIINNEGDDAVVGTFNNLPEGSLVTIGDSTLYISYMGGDGNDVALNYAETLVSLVDGKLTIKDVGSASDDDITFLNNGTTFAVSNLEGPVIVTGDLTNLQLSGDTVVTVPLQSITNGIEFIGGEGTNGITITDPLTLSGASNSLTLSGIDTYTQVDEIFGENYSLNIGGDFSITGNNTGDITLAEVTANSLTISGFANINDSTDKITIAGTTNLTADYNITIDDGEDNHEFNGPISINANGITITAGATMTFEYLNRTDHPDLDQTGRIFHNLTTSQGDIILDGTVDFKTYTLTITTGESINQESGTITAQYLTLNGNNTGDATLNETNEIFELRVINSFNSTESAFTNLSFSNAYNLALYEIDINEATFTAPIFIIRPNLITDTDYLTNITKTGTGTANFNGNIDVVSSSGGAFINHNAGTINFNGDTNGFGGNITYTGAAETITNINNSDNTYFPSPNANNGFTFGSLTATGNIAMSTSAINILNDATFTSATLAPEINSGTDYGKLNVTGTVTLNNTTLAPIASQIINQEIIFIDNSDADAVVGTFNNLPEGSLFTVGDLTSVISYVGGTGNDVALTLDIETEVSLVDGKLTITDVLNESNDDITFSNDGSTLTISNLVGGVFISGDTVLPTLTDATTVTVLLDDITNGIVFIGGEGTNSITFENDLTLTGVDNDITLTGLNGYTQNGSINIQGDFIAIGSGFDLLLGELTANNLTINFVDNILDQELALTITGVTILQAVDGIDIDNGQSRHSFAGEVNLTAGQIVFTAGSDTTFGTVRVTDTGVGSVHELTVAPGDITFNGNVTIAGSNANLFVCGNSNISQTSGIIEATFLFLRGNGNTTTVSLDNNNDIDILATRNPQNANDVAFASLSFTNIANLFLEEIHVNEFDLTAPKFTLVPDFTVITKEGTGVSNFNGNIDVDDDDGTAIINHNAGTINFNGDTTDFDGNITYTGVAGTTTNINSVTTNFPSPNANNGFTFGSLTASGNIAMSTSVITILNDVTFNSATLAPEINSGTDYGKLNVTGTVTLNNTTLAPISSQNIDQEIIFIENSDTDAIIGTFNNLAEGSGVSVGDLTGVISYVGGTGNDVALTLLNDVETLVSLVDGKLTITDVGSASDDDITFFNTAVTFAVSDLEAPVHVIGDPPNIILSGTTTINVRLESITNGIEFIGGEGTNNITIERYLTTGTLTLPGASNSLTLSDIDTYTQDQDIALNIGGDFSITGNNTGDITLGEVTAGSLTVSGFADINDSTDKITIAGITDLTASNFITINDGSNINQFGGIVSLEASSVVFNATGDLTFGTVTTTGTDNTITNFLGTTEGEMDLSGPILTAGNSNLTLRVGGDEINQTAAGTITTNRLALEGNPDGNSGALLEAANNDILALQVNNVDNPINSFTFEDINTFELLEITVGNLFITANTFIFSDATEITINGIGDSNINGGIDVTATLNTNPAIINHNAGNIIFDDNNSGMFNFSGAFQYNGAVNLTLTRFYGNVLIDTPDFTQTFGYLEFYGDEFYLASTSTINTQNDSRFTSILSGSGTFTGSRLLGGANSTINPGSEDATGQLTTANLEIDGGTFSPTINSDTDFDSIHVNGTLTLTDAEFVPTGDFNIISGVESIILISNNDDDAVIGTFNNLPEGSFVTTDVDLVVGMISYVGGTGNDVVLIPDTIDPIAVCQDLSLEIDENITVHTVTGDQLDGGSSDNGEIAEFLINGESSIDLTLDDLGNNEVTITVVDGSGNTSECTATITLATSFITLWETTTDNESITIPTEGDGYDYTVDWGDDTIESGFTADATHTYATAGEYEVRIFGDFPRIYFNFDSDDPHRLKIKEVSQWGSNPWENMSRAFSGCENLQITATDIPDLSNVTDVSAMFAFCNALTGNATFNQWNMETIMDISFMFLSADNFDQNLSDWDISSLTDANQMFSSATLSVENYDNTLIGWATLDTDAGETQIPTGVTFGGGNSTYCFSKVKRQELISDLGWIITDAGQDAVCTASSFITVWKTTTDNESITIPTIGNGYNYIVDWGDETIEGGFTSSATHTYASAGTYSVSIIGDFSLISFGFASSPGNSAKIREVSQWGTNPWASMESAFYGCENLDVTATDSPNLSEAISINNMFNGCSALTGNPTFNQWDVSTIKFMDYMFRNCTVFNTSLDNWNVSSVETMNNMFAGATAFNQDIGNWDVSSATSLFAMFYSAESFNQSLGNWDISNFDRGDYMFDNAGLSTENYDATLIGWATLDTDAGETQIPTNLGFDGGNSQYCESELERFELIDTYGWTITDGGKVIDCINSDSFVTVWETTTASESITIPTEGDGYNYIVNWGDGTEGLFTSDATHIYTAAGTYTVSIIGNFPRIYLGNSNGSNRTKIKEVSQWGTNPWASMDFAFYGCANLDVTAIDVPDLSEATSTKFMFYDCSNLEGNEYFNDWNVSTIKDMDLMFRNCIVFNADLDNWNVSSVLDMSNMFAGATAFNQDIGNWDVSSLETATNMFYSAESFNQSLGNWDISNFDRGDYMFDNAGLSTENYDATLIGWATLDTDAGETQIPMDIIFDGGNSQYCASDLERFELIGTYGWTITDGGKVIDCINSDSFVTVWETTTANESITIPTHPDSEYNYIVNWGDGTEGLFTANATHTYATAGTYTVSIIGNFPRIFFNNTGDKAKIKDVSQWGTNPWATMEKAFYGCANLKVTATDVPDLSDVTSTSAMFKDCGNLAENTAFNTWNVATIEDMSNMFAGCYSFNAELNNWNVSNVLDMNNMFASAFDFNADISSWNVGSVTNMQNLFFGATSLDQDLSSWNVSSVNNMSGMFRSSSFNNDISSWDVSGVDNMSNMFRNTPFNQDLGAWDISSITNMASMFTSVTLSTTNYDNTLIGWATLDTDAGETQIPTGISFGGGNSQYCESEFERFELMDVYTWTITDGEQAADCINNVNDYFITVWETTTTNESITIPTTGAGYSYRVDWGDGTEGLFTADATHTYADAGTYSVSIIGNFPRIFFNNEGDNAAKILEVSQWGSNPWTSMESAFASCVNLNVTATDSPDLSEVTSTNFMFYGCSNIEGNEYFNDWNVSTIQSMELMFRDCTVFNTDLDNWNVSSVVNMTGMFENAQSFNGNITTWNVSEVQAMDFMFVEALGFNQDIGDWDVSDLENTSYMFINASNFNQDLGDWDISNLLISYGMFLSAGLSTENYDATLIGWATLDTDAGETQIPTGVFFDGGNSQYCESELERFQLIDTYNWTITDGGKDADCTNGFITLWETTTANESITIPTTGTGYNYLVDWGDGTTEGGLTGNATHTYATAGTYTVSIVGNFPRIFFNFAGDGDKIQEVTKWGPNPWTSMENAFAGCENLDVTATDAPNLSNATSTSAMFADCTNLAGNTAFNTWDVSTIKDMSHMFANCFIFDTDISNWNVSNVTDMNTMFFWAFDFNQDISSWNVSSVTNMQNVFFTALNFDQDLSSWNVSNVTNMSGMFRNSSFNNDISSWDVSNVEDMKNMLRKTPFNQDIGAWDISSVTSMAGMFNDATLSTENYDATLIGWATLDAGEIQIPTNVTFDGGNSTYCVSETERQELIDLGWTITDGGLDAACGDVMLAAKVCLQGAALNPNVGEENLMRDDLRVAGLIPTRSPYADMISCDATVFNTTGNDAIVDWVWVEIRDENNNATVVSSQSALLQRDGDIVSTDGASALSFEVSSGNYYISVQHRNHLGIMSANTMALNATATTVDFTNTATPTFGSNAQTSFGVPTGTVAMWTGNVNSDTLIQYSGTNPDTPDILSEVLNDPGNFLNFPTFAVSGYKNYDINMDGIIQYSGTNPDTPFILQNIIAHPGNFLNFSTYQIQEQLPQN